MSMSPSYDTAIEMSGRSKLRVGGDLRVSGYRQPLNIQTGSQVDVGKDVILGRGTSDQTTTDKTSKAEKSSVRSISESVIANVFSSTVAPLIPSWKP